MKFTLVYVVSLIALSANEVLSTPLLRREDVCSGQGNNGKQDPGGFCSTTALGHVPAADNMPSTLIISPEYNAVLEPNTAFDIKVAFQNLATGHFSDPDTQYYTEPQSLNSDGLIEGHVHVTVQGLTGDDPPEAKKFEFFEGLNDDAGSKGSLSVSVTSGLAAGSYRICSLTGSFSHQPVVMPVAKRGPQDDCIRITVSGRGKGTEPLKPELKNGKAKDQDVDDDDPLKSELKNGKAKDQDQDPIDPKNPLKFDATP